MKNRGFLGLQGLVFFLVVAAFSNIYLTQPVLPILAAEFGVNETGASLSISLVILGIVLSNLPFGRLGDRYPTVWRWAGRSSAPSPPSWPVWRESAPASSPRMPRPPGR